MGLGMCSALQYGVLYGAVVAAWPARPHLPTKSYAAPSFPHPYFARLPPSPASALSLPSFACASSSILAILLSTIPQPPSHTLPDQSLIPPFASSGRQQSRNTLLHCTAPGTVTVTALIYPSESLQLPERPLPGFLPRLFLRGRNLHAVTPSTPT